MAGVLKLCGAKFLGLRTIFNEIYSTLTVKALKFYQTHPGGWFFGYTLGYTPAGGESLSVKCKMV